jgi:phytoene dehydrogenase-like protein
VSPATVVIGTGASELVAAHLLARGGHRVIVVAQASSGDAIGVPSPAVQRELDLMRHGLKVEQPDPWMTVPLPDGGRLELWRDVARSAEAIRRVSASDAAKWPAFCERMARLSGFLQALYEDPPPDPLALRFGLRVRRLGLQGMEDLMRLLAMPVAELLDEWFESDALKGALGAIGVRQLQQGPRSGGTSFRFLHHHVGSPPGVFLPARSNLGTILARLPGIELRLNTEVARITVDGGRVAAVALSSGEEIQARLVVSGVDPGRTLLAMIDAAWLDPALVQAVRHIRRRGVVARMSATLDRAPGFNTLVIAPSLDYLERAYDDSKYGRVSSRPALEAWCDDTHRLDIRVQFAPYDLREGEWHAERAAALQKQVIGMLAGQMHGATPIEQRMQTPRELEQLDGWPEGQADHAELALDQALWMRPIPQLARYRTPVEGLWLCGPAMHPGGIIAGAAGRLCAKLILEPRVR